MGLPIYVNRGATLGVIQLASLDLALFPPDVNLD